MNPGKKQQHKKQQHRAPGIKDDIILIRVSSEEKESLKRKAEKRGFRGMSDYIRFLASCDVGV